MTPDMQPNFRMSIAPPKSKQEKVKIPSSFTSCLPFVIIDANRNWRLNVSKVKSEPIQNVKELEFTIFCVENIAIKFGVGAERVYDALTESGLLNSYIVPGYETLHTQDKGYIIDDILSVMSEKGVEL